MHSQSLLNILSLASCKRIQYICHGFTLSIINSTFLFVVAVEDAIKAYLKVSLSAEAARSLTSNLAMAELFGKIQHNLGKIVLCWMGENVDWEVRELVEGLVFSRTLGRHTTALCTEQGICCFSVEL